MSTLVVIYGVKSSPDEKGAVADQLQQAREAIDREGDRDIAGVFSEENESGSRKERGPELAAALRLAYELADEGQDVEIWVWHSSRLARGTGKKGGKRALGKLLYDLRERGVLVRSVQDNEFTTNEQLWGIASSQSSRYAEDLSGWVKDGIDRRRVAGKPVGAVPFGYMVEPTLDADGKMVLDKKGKVVNRRVPDPKTGPVRAEAMERLGDGAKPGAVARWLNDQGFRTHRGNAFRARSVREMAESPANGYPAVCSPDVAERARNSLDRMDPVAVQRRAGGLPPREPAVLEGVASCECRSPLYSTTKYLGRRRSYICSHKVNSTGVHDDAKPILAELLETHILDHLACFTDRLEEWLAEVMAERDGERKLRETALDQEKAALAVLDRQRDDRLTELKSVGFHPIALEAVEELDQQRESQKQRISEAEAVLSEWATTPEVNDTLDAYNRLYDMVQGRVKNAQGARELNEALASVLAGLWCRIEGGRLHVDFELRDQSNVIVPDDPVLPQEHPERDFLPPVAVDSIPTTSPR
jgi:DNA invertase Pin-like site-specific DNA recombinase